MLYNEKIAKRFFCYKKKYWYKNVANVPKYLRAIHYLIKHGYDEYATWEIYDWFLHTMKDILTEYNNSKNSYPILLEEYPMTKDEMDKNQEKVDENEKLWDSILNEMIYSLNKIIELEVIDFSNKQTHEAKTKVREKLKDRFFELFSTYFWHLWD